MKLIKINIDRFPFLLLLLTLLLSVIHYNFGWIPHDEGLFHGCAERVANGELPHIDFYICYTGFLAYYNNLLHILLGDNILSTRYPLILLNLGIISLVFTITKKLYKDFAFLISALCLVWGMNNYFAPLTSWYCLFFGLVSLYIIICLYQEKDSIYYIFLAGLIAGVSFLFKQSSGTYNSLAILTYLCIEYLKTSRPNSVLSHILKGICYIFLTLNLFFIIDLLYQTQYLWLTIYLSLFYIIFITLTIKKNTAAADVIDPNINYKFIKKITAFFMAFIFIGLPYYSIFIYNSCFLKFLKHIFIMKSIYSRLFNLPAYSDIPTITVLFIFTLIISYLLKLSNFIKILSKISLSVFLLSISIIYFIIISSFYGESILFKTIWDLIALIPIITVFFSTVAILNANYSIKLLNSNTFIILTLFAFFFFLTIVPYGYALYFVYFIPFFFIPLIYILLKTPNEITSYYTKTIKITLVIFIVLGIYLNGKYRIQIGGVAKRPSIISDYSLLNLRRGGIYVPYYDKIVYENLYKIVNFYTKPNDYIFAFTECSEMYYLFNRKNPCWHLYTDTTSEIESYTEILNKLLKNKVKLVIYKSYAEEYIPSTERDTFVHELLKLYPIKYQVGHFFVGIKNSKELR